MTRRSQRAFTIVEVLIAAAMLIYATWAFLGIYAVTVRESVHSQFLYLADFTGDSLLDEVAAHQFGRSAPKAWGLGKSTTKGEWQTVRYDVWVDGKQVPTVFHVQWNFENGSFVGLARKSTDVVTVVISWAEGEGEDPPYGAFTDVYYEGDNRHLVLQVPVWR